MQLAYPKTYMCKCSSLFKLMFFFFHFFCQGRVLSKEPKISHFVFWLQHLSGTDLRFEVMPNPLAASVYTISSSCHFRQKLASFCWFWLGSKCSLKWLQWHIFKVWGVPNPMEMVLSLYDKWFMTNHNFRQKFHILLILTGKNALKWLEWCIFRVQGMPNPMALVSSLYDKQFLKNQNFRRQVA